MADSSCPSKHVFRAHAVRHFGSSQWKQEMGMKCRVTSGNDPVIRVLTRRRKTPSGTLFSALQATVHA
jgi:hypothetical protein